jgi:hypothetical protein
LQVNGCGGRCPIGKQARAVNESILELVNKSLIVAGMNRLSPLIVRQAGPFAPMRMYDLPRADDAVSDPLADLKLFATGWVGGLVFFGTLLA